MKSAPRDNAAPGGLGSEHAVFVIGAGHFGMRAARLLLEAGGTGPLFVVDTDEGRLAAMRELPLERVACDGVRFLVENYTALHPDSTVVPAVPIHLAYEWLKGSLEGVYVFRQREVPGDIKCRLPQTWRADDGSLLLSFADYLCPDDCPEPEYCTVTGERRDPTLHDLLAGLRPPDMDVHVIRSRQLAPGLGGYATAVLADAARRITAEVPGRWLLGTACRCHGVVSCFDIVQRSREARGD